MGAKKCLRVCSWCLKVIDYDNVKLLNRTTCWDCMAQLPSELLHKPSMYTPDIPPDVEE